MNTTEVRFTGLKPSELNDVEKQSVAMLAMKVLSIEHRAGKTLSSPDETRNFLRLRLADYRNEVFGCLFLDDRHRIIAVRELFQGTIDGASIHPRVVVQQAMEANAASMVSYHNHPLRGSGTQPCGRDDHPPAEKGACTTLPGKHPLSRQGRMCDPVLLPQRRNTMSNSSNDRSTASFFGEVISTYTRTQAIDDGVLIDAGSRGQEAFSLAGDSLSN